jgi:hypothetical protein
VYATGSGPLSTGRHHRSARRGTGSTPAIATAANGGDTSRAAIPRNSTDATTRSGT